MRRSCILLLALIHAGCVTPKRDAAAEARGFERGYGQAVKEQYWIIQRQQRVAAPGPNHPQPPVKRSP